MRMSPRKVRLAADMIRGKKAAAALDILEFSKRWASRPLSKLLKSAMANATHNFNLQKDNLYIKTIKVDGGPMLKRWRARAFGRAAAIQKKSSHITIVLDEIKKEVEAPKSKEVAKADKKQLTVKKTKVIKKEKK